MMRGVRDLTKVGDESAFLRASAARSAQMLKLSERQTRYSNGKSSRRALLVLTERDVEIGSEQRAMLDACDDPVQLRSKPERQPPMTQLRKSLEAWSTPEFESILKRELEQLDTRTLPLQQGLTRGSHVGEDPFTVMIIKVTEEPHRLQAVAGIFYTGIIAGCNCADDPTPVEGETEYCEIEVTIDRATAEATFRLPDI